MSTSRTYTVGDQGGVRRLTDLTLPWIDVSVSNVIPATALYPLYDVETDPIDGDKVFVVGKAPTEGAIFGIYVSMDGGNTWIVPGGDYQTNAVQGELNWYEVWVLDSNNIMVAGHNGYVAISNDGGLTFNLTTQLPLLPTCVACPSIIPTVWSVHFISPTVGVVGLDAHVALTINGGATWTILNSGNVILEGSFPDQLINGRGIRMSADQQNIVVVGQPAAFQSLDGGTTWTNVYHFVQRNGQHLTWINEQELWAFGNLGERIKSIDGGTTWSVLGVGGVGGPDQLAGHFYLGQNGFFSQNANILSTNNGASSGSLSETSPYGINAVWTWYEGITCYTLISCDGSESPILVDNDLSSYIGDVIRVCPTDMEDPSITECKCFTITVAQGCLGAISLLNTNLIYNDCISCTPVCYFLVDCTDPNNYITTSDDFSDYVGQIVKLSECPDTCWQVVRAANCQGAICVSEVIASFITCVECLPEVPLPEPLELHPRRIKPGYYTAGCSPEYTEKVSCNFGDQMYNQMLVDRYGLTICCEEDRIKWIIKKQLLDFKAIYDPELCRSSLSSCCPPTCLEVILQVFTPLMCLAPENVEAEIDFSLECLPPENVHVYIQII